MKSTIATLLLSAALLATAGTQPRIGTAFNVSYSVAPPHVAFAMMGWSIGASIPFFPPFTCVAGPCNWYVAPIAGQYLAFPIQGGGYDGSKNCVELSGAISFAIMP